jgi:hypothetical protein
MLDNSGLMFTREFKIGATNSDAQRMLGENVANRPLVAKLPPLLHNLILTGGLLELLRTADGIAQIPSIGLTPGLSVSRAVIRQPNGLYVVQLARSANLGEPEAIYLDGKKTSDNVPFPVGGEIADAVTDQIKNPAASSGV